MRPAEYETLRAMEDQHWWYLVLRWLVARELRQRLPAGARVLDAGCGTGGMMARLAQGNWEVEGVDLSERAVEHCRERGLTQARTGSVQALPWPDRRFDAVLSLDVLYHADVDEETAFQEMLRVLRPGGWMVLNLPAFDCLRGSHDVAVCGLRRYTASYVRHWLRSHKLHIEMIHYWNAWLFLPLLVRRQGWRSAASDLDAMPRWLNQALAAIGKVDALLARGLHLPWGSSLFAIVRKPVEEDPAHG